MPLLRNSLVCQTSERTPVLGQPGWEREPHGGHRLLLGGRGDAAAAGTVRLSATVWRQHWERLLSFPTALTGWGQHLGGLARTLIVMKSEPFADLVWVQLNFSQLSTDA